MKSTSLERIVGLFVLAAIGCMSFFALKLGSLDLRPTETYLIEARFSNASGLIVGSQVSVAGVPIGTVTEMKLAKDFSAIVGMRIRKPYFLPTDSIASIRGHGLLGDKYIALSPGADEEVLKPGARITDTESAVDLESLLSRFAFGAMQGDKAEKKEAPKAP